MLQIKIPVLVLGAGLEEVLIAVENWKNTRIIMSILVIIIGRQTPHSPLSQGKLSRLTCLSTSIDIIIRVFYQFFTAINTSSNPAAHIKQHFVVTRQEA